MWLELLKQIDKMANDYLTKVRSMAGEQRKEQLNNIQKLFNQSKKFGDEKVQLALQTYEMVNICLIYYLLEATSLYAAKVNVVPL